MRTFRIALLAMALCLAATAFAQATVWDVTNDFSTSANPNGAWEYGYVDKTTGLYTPFTAGQLIDFMGSPTWYTTDPTNSSIITKNTSGIAQTDGYSYIEPGQVFMHSGPAAPGVAAVIHWASPVTGIVSLSGMFTGQTYSPITTNARVVILKNSTTVLLDSTLSGFYGTAAANYADRSGDSPFVTFSDTWNVTAGDYYDFVTLPILDPTYGTSFKGCGFSATITQVPEPCSMLALAGGLGALIMRRRRL